MIPKTELDLGARAAERELYVIDTLRLYTKNTGAEYFPSHVPRAIAGGKSAWGYLEYPQDKGSHDNHIAQAFSDLKLHGIFEVDPQYYYRNHSSLYKIKDVDAVEFGIFASKRTYRVLTEISKFYSIKNYKLFGRVITGKKDKSTGFQPSFWKCKIIRGTYYVEIDDLINLGLITTTDGSEGYRKYSITDHGRDFMCTNNQYLSGNYRI